MSGPLPSARSAREMQQFARASAGDDLLNALAVASTREKELNGVLKFNPWFHNTSQTVSPIPENPNYRVPFGRRDAWGSPSRFANLIGSNTGNSKVVASAGAGAHRLPPSVPGGDLTAMEEAALAHLNPTPAAPRQKVVIETPVSRLIEDDHHFLDYTPDPELSMADLAALAGDDVDIPGIYYFDDSPPTPAPFTSTPCG